MVLCVSYYFCHFFRKAPAFRAQNIYLWKKLYNLHFPVSLLPLCVVLAFFRTILYSLVFFFGERFGVFGGGEEQPKKIRMNKKHNYSSMISYFSFNGFSCVIMAFFV